MAVHRPTYLTPEEAAAIARCSIRTVRRAYKSGALVAYRRRGSRAVLLDNDDVLAWTGTSSSADDTASYNEQTSGYSRAGP